MEFRIRETPKTLRVMPDYHHFDFSIKNYPSGYFGSFYEIAERYSPLIAKLEINQGTGLNGVWKKLANPVEVKFSSRQERVQHLIDNRSLLNTEDIEIAKNAIYNSYPEQAYLISFLGLIGKGQELDVKHTSLLTMMSRAYEISKT